MCDVVRLINSHSKMRQISCAFHFKYLKFHSIPIGNANNNSEINYYYYYYYEPEQVTNKSEEIPHQSNHWLCPSICFSNANADFYLKNAHLKY